MKAIVCRNERKGDDSKVGEVIEALAGYGIDAYKADEVCGDCDVVITVGGDGTILHHGKQAARYGKPLLGINTGRLGFMTSIEADELDKLKRLTGGEYAVSSRMLLDVIVNDKTYLALNDAVFNKEANVKLPEFTVRSDGHIISEIRADGLIVSTATGSTAYALSAGGPIIEPELDCMELVPICAHSLFGRAMVLSGEREVTVEFSGQPDKIYMSADGEEGVKLARGERVIIKRSEMCLKLIDLKGASFYNALNNKLIRPIK